MPDLDAKKPLPAPLQALCDEFGNWTKELHKKEAEEPVSKIDEPLYHYTDGLGLKGILQSQTIRFTDYRHLNDPSEYSFGIEVAAEVARQLSPSGQNEPVRHFNEILLSMFKSPKVTENLGYFIASFSRNGNDLGQWRAYADNGRGYAIGFHPHAFSASEKPNQQSNEKVFVGPVLYDMKVAEQRYADAIDRADHIVLDAHSKYSSLMTDPAITDEFMQELSREMLAYPLIWYALTSKHPAYKHEKEVRLIMLGLRQAQMPFIETRLRGSEIVPYISYAMPMRGARDLVEIVVGPAASGEAVSSVDTLLDSLGIDPSVRARPSDIPYRAL